MKFTLFLGVLLFLSPPCDISGQSAQPIAAPGYASAAQSAESVPSNIARISQSVETLNRNLAKFFSNFSANQGLKLSDRQQKLLFALEVLNRAEASLLSVQKQRIEHVERLSRMRLQLAGVNENLLPQSLDRYVSLRGTTNVVEIRDARRQALQKEQYELTNTVTQVQAELDRLLVEIERLQLLVASLRARLFGEVEKELADL